MNRKFGPLFFLAVAGTLLVPRANAASCKTQAQMTAAQRDSLSSAARAMVAQVQSGDVQTLRNDTIPAVAADFSGIAASATNLKPIVEHATITVDDMYALDASTVAAGTPRTDFYCGTRIVVLNIDNLPPGKYGLAILHATGVPHPQQISLILSETSENHWMLAGFFSSPMVEAGHDGLWYWEQARQYAQKKMSWNAWFYYQTAGYLLDPLGFLHSPNLDKLQREADQVRPTHLPGATAMTLNSQGNTFVVTAMNPTDALGGFDLEVHYTPDGAQQAQLRDPVAARKQVMDIMQGLLALYPELRVGFRGIWVRADLNGASIYALDLPMDQIVTGAPPAPAAQTSNPAGP